MIFHLTEPAVWTQMSAAGALTESTRGASLEDVGFIHCSYLHQVETVAGFVYLDWPGVLLLLEIDVDRVPSPVRVESGDGGRDAYPHVYGPVPVAAVVGVHRMTRADDTWRLPVALATT